MNQPGLPMDILERAVASLPGDQLAAARKTALQHFKLHGFPTLRDEDWKYTDLARVVDISRQSLTTRADSVTADVDRIRELQATIDAAWLVFANGELLRDLSSGFAEDDIEVSPLRLQSADGRLDDPLSDLNVALLREGLSVRISSDRTSDRPIGLMIVDFAAAAPVASQVRIDIVLEQNAAARFVEYHASFGDAAHYSNTVIELAAKPGARAEYLRFQNRALNHSQTARLNVSLDRDSSFRHCGVDLGGHLTRNDVKIDILGSGAAAAFDGLYIAGEGQHVDNHTRVDHRVGNSTSRQEYRGILNGRCRAIWNGKAIVHKGADGTDANQANHNLLLSESAEIDTKPELEIYADEVKCAHGTTVGQIDDQALFYLRTRGVDLEHAKRILTRAFAASVVNRSPIEELHDLIGDAVEQRLRDFVTGGRP